VHDPKGFDELVLPRFFKTMTRYASFLHELKLLGFRRLVQKTLDQGAFYKCSFAARCLWLVAFLLVVVFLENCHLPLDGIPASSLVSAMLLFSHLPREMQQSDASTAEEPKARRKRRVRRAKRRRKSLMRRTPP